MTKITRKHAATRIAEIKNELEALYKELATLAVDHQIYTDISGPTYGMGGSVNLKHYHDDVYGEFLIGDWTASSMYRC
jgi:hypothetical protein